MILISFSSFLSILLVGAIVGLILLLMWANSNSPYYYSNSTRQFKNRIHTLRHGLVTEGTIVGVKTFGLNLFDEFPIVRFKTSQGQWLTLRCEESTRGPGFRKGQKVEVRFLPVAPEKFIVVTGLDFLV